MKTWAPNLVTLQDRARNDEWHKRRLSEIQQRPRNVSPPSTSKLRSNLQRGQCHQERERVRGIEDANSRIFQRLVKLSEHRRSSSVKTRGQPSTFQPHSLNSVWKKQEHQRIQQANAVLGLRLETKLSTIDVKKLRHEYQLATKYSQLASKRRVQGRLQRLAGQQVLSEASSPRAKAAAS